MKVLGLLVDARRLLCSCKRGINFERQVHSGIARKMCCDCGPGVDCVICRRIAVFCWRVSLPCLEACYVLDASLRFVTVAIETIISCSVHCRVVMVMLAAAGSKESEGLLKCEMLSVVAAFQSPTGSRAGIFLEV